MLLKQSTAVKIPFFMADSTDSITGKTGLSPTVTLAKDGAAFSAAAGTVTEVGNGWYYLSAIATGTNDIGTLGSLVLHATATGADPWDEDHQVVVDLPGASVSSVTGNVGGSVASVTSGVTVTTNNDKTGYALSSLAIQAIWDALTSAFITTGSIGKLIKDNLDATISSVVALLPTALVGGRIDASVGAYQTGLAPLQPTTAGRTLDVAATGEAGLDFDNIKDATGAHTLTNITVPTVTTTTTATTVTNLSSTAVSSIWDKLVTGITTAGSIGQYVKDIYTQVVSGGLSLTNIAFEVWEETVANHSDSGTAGQVLTNVGDQQTYLTANISSLIWGTLTSTLTAAGSIGKLITDNLDATISSVANLVALLPAAGQIATAVWDEDLTFHGSGTAGYEVDTTYNRVATLLTIDTNVLDIKAKTDNLPADPASNTEVDTRLAANAYTAPPSVSAIADAVWNRLTSAITTAGSIGKLLVDNINASISSRLASVDYTAPNNSGIAAIKAKTDNLPVDPAAEAPILAAIAAIPSGGGGGGGGCQVVGLVVGNGTVIGLVNC